MKRGWRKNGVLETDLGRFCVHKCIECGKWSLRTGAGDVCGFESKEAAQMETERQLERLVESLEESVAAARKRRSFSRVA